MSAQAAKSLNPVRAEAKEGPRAEFLRGSSWADAIWIFAPTNVLEQDEPVRIRWDFGLPRGGRFTDPERQAWLQTARRALAAIRRRSLSTGLGQRGRTVEGYFLYLRTLIRWMDAEGLSRFADLDSDAVIRFQQALRRRRTQSGRSVAPATVQKYLDLLVYLHRYREEIGDGLLVDPCPGQTTGALVGVYEATRRTWPHTPDAVALPLINRSIDYLGSCAVDLLRARELYARAVATAKARRLPRAAWRAAGADALKGITLQTFKGPQTLSSAADLMTMLDVLYLACFVVIVYLVGPRASEVLHLRAGCVRPLAPEEAGGEGGLAVIVGAIFKREPGFHGRPHQWVAPPPAIHAIAVLEALSAAHRARSGRSELWLRALSACWRDAAEWHDDTQAPVRIPTTGYLRALLQRCARWFDLPTHDGKPWALSTHQGRKTFVRFAALRDRTALFALAQHLGHRERGITDRSYAGTDYLLNREIDAAILEQSVSAWEQMLAAEGLGGRAGAEILAQRPRFRGAHMKQDLKRYAQMLVDSGLTLGVCHWGFCVYRQESSACLGSATAPDPVRREPSTCARCKNFAVSTRHRSYWTEQARRNEALLNNSVLPAQTLKVARERIQEALAMVRSIDAPGTPDHEP